MTFKEVVGAQGPIARVGSVLFDLVFVNILWLIFGGPALVLVLHVLPLGEPTGTVTIIDVISAVVLIVFMGPATTASYAALGKRQRHEESYTFRDFWHSYKINFGQAIGVTVPLILFAGMLAYSVWVELNNQMLFGKLIYFTIPVQGFVAIELVFILQYLYGLLARFELTTKELFKYAFMMANKHLPMTLLLTVLLAAILAATFLWNLGVMLFGFGVLFYLDCLLLERVFRNYMPEEDLDNDYLTDDPVQDVESVRAAVRKADKDAEEQMKADRQAIIDKYTKGK